MEQWLRFGFVALFILLFLRRAFRIKTRTSPNQTTPNQTTVSQPAMMSVPPRPRRGKKDDFRDIPPPPENPELG
jgi:hypothetical protein